MNRWWLAVVLGLTVTGCAAGVVDPLPAPDPEPAPTQKAPPKQTLSTELPADPAEETSLPKLPPLQLELPKPGGWNGQPAQD